MPETTLYLQLFLTVFFLNVIPAFMPPTWIVLAFFYTHFNLGFIPTVLLGAVAATSGRLVLASLSRYFFRPFLPTILKKNYLALGEFFKQNQHLTIPLVLTYGFLPIPSNQIFIIAGLSGVNLSLIGFSFLIARIISYSFWITLADQAVTYLSSFPQRNLNHTLYVEASSLGLLILLGLIDWAKLLKVKIKK